MSELRTNRIIQGDCLDVLDTLPGNSIHCVMTSPPYWNLRDYDHEEQLGLEETSEAYVENIADVMDAVKRVLRPDGSLWLNLGDTYEDKDLQQIPARVALELQNRGWILRNRVTWAKPDAMPQSVKDRLNDRTEPIFHFVNSNDYFYDLDAIREPHETQEQGTPGNGLDELAETGMAQHGQGKSTLTKRDPKGKNPGDVFEVVTPRFSEAHFAVYPPELCEKPIKATCPSDGVVLDPFTGAGTTLLKAKELGRNYVGIELNPEYADMARARVGLDVVNPENIRDDKDQSGLEAYE